jgi:hypothetical protein
MFDSCMNHSESLGIHNDERALLQTLNCIGKGRVGRYRFRESQSGFNRANLKPVSYGQERSMSLVGQIRKSGRATGQSALPLRTDLASRACQVRKVPRCDIGERCHTDAPMNNCGKSATSALRCIGRLPIQQNIVHPDFHRDFHVRVRQNIEAPVLHRVDCDPCDVGGG